ncbi:hypothetical protein Tco_0247309, partial [Tanacetum coccineum]
MVSMASQAAFGVLGFALINLFRRVEERVRKIQDLTMESAVIHSCVGGVDVEASVTGFSISDTIDNVKVVSSQRKQDEWNCGVFGQLVWGAWE